MTSGLNTGQLKKEFKFLNVRTGPAANQPLVGDSELSQIEAGKGYEILVCGYFDNEWFDRWYLVEIKNNRNVEYEGWIASSRVKPIEGTGDIETIPPIDPDQTCDDVFNE